MKKIRNTMIGMMLGTLLFVCLIASAAQAATDTGSTSSISVWVNNVELTETLPYLKNGSSTATDTKPGNAGYVYFNAAEGTVTLNNAVITTLTTISGQDTSRFLMYANGSVDVELVGSSIILCNTTFSGTVYGMQIFGESTINGDGLLTISISDTAAGSNVYGIATAEVLGIVASVSIEVKGYQQGIGLYSINGIKIGGGDITITANGATAVGIAATNGIFMLWDSNVKATATSTSTFAAAIDAAAVILTGGTGEFTASDGSEASYGILLTEYTGEGLKFIEVGNSQLVVSGSKSAIYSANKEATLEHTGTVYVSTSADGSNLKEWTSLYTDGTLIGYSSVGSKYKYALFGNKSTDLSNTDYTVPQTGDDAKPYEWLLTAIVAVAGMAVLAKRNRGAARAAKQDCVK